MGKFAIVLGFILVLILAFRFLMPGVSLPGQKMIRSILPGSSAPSVQHVASPPYMFGVTTSQTVVHLP